MKPADCMLTPQAAAEGLAGGPRLANGSRQGKGCARVSPDPMCTSLAHLSPAGASAYTVRRGGETHAHLAFDAAPLPGGRRDPHVGRCVSAVSPPRPRT